MATYRAKCWLGSSSGYQELEVKSSTLYGAKEQFKRIYGAEQVINLRKVDNDSGSNISLPSSDYGSMLFALLILWIVIEFWKIVIPIAVIVLIGYLYQRFRT